MTKEKFKRKEYKLSREERLSIYMEGREDGAREMRKLMKSFSWISRLFNWF